MALRSAHGDYRDSAGALLVVETAPPDELPVGVPAPTGPVERRPDGTFTAGGARVAGRLAGRRSADRRRFAARLGDQLGMATVGPELEPYVEVASEFASAQIRHLAETVGGGSCGPGPSSLVQSAALALAASRYLYASGSQTGCPKVLGQAAILADKSRTSLLTAHELVAREAQGRAAANPDADWFTGDEG